MNSGSIHGWEAERGRHVPPRETAKAVVANRHWAYPSSSRCCDTGSPTRRCRLAPRLIRRAAVTARCSFYRVGGPTLLPADAERVGMPAVATVTSYAEQGLTAVAVALSALALLVWGYHLLGPSTAETLTSAFLWTFLTVCAWAVMLAVERLGGV